jgi:hypothetical protein
MTHPFVLELQNCGHSPRTEGESLRIDGVMGSDSYQLQQCGFTAGTASGGEPRGEASPGKQFPPACIDFCGIAPRHLLATELTTLTRAEMRIFLHEETAKIKRQIQLAIDMGDTAMHHFWEPELQYISKIQRGQGEWLEYRIGLERRVRQKSFKIRRECELIGVNYSRQQLFRNRMYLVPTLELVCEKKELMELVKRVSTLDWRSADLGGWADV